MDYAAKFAAGLSYADFLQTYGTDEHRQRWAAVYAEVRLTAEQKGVLAGFQRDMHVLCIAGAWCGDCVNQCPIFEHFAVVNPRVKLRFVDRDADAELMERWSVCGGARVPAVLFLSEDFQQTGFYGDRTLSKYRRLASDLFGAACPTGLVPEPNDLLGAVIQDWLDEFERNQLILRTSARLRKLHGD